VNLGRPIVTNGVFVVEVREPIELSFGVVCGWLGIGVLDGIDILQWEGRVLCSFSPICFNGVLLIRIVLDSSVKS